MGSRSAILYNHPHQPLSPPHLPNIHSRSSGPPDFIPCLGSSRGFCLTGCSAQQSYSNGTSELQTGFRNTDRCGSQQPKGARRKSVLLGIGGSWGRGHQGRDLAPNQESEDLLNTDYTPTILISQNTGLPSLSQNTKYLHTWSWQALTVEWPSCGA